MPTQSVGTIKRLVKHTIANRKQACSYKWTAAVTHG
jgi:hypothetical protein